MIPILIVFLMSISSIGSNSVKTYNQTDIFIDIEAERSATWLGCDTENLKEENALMTFYLLAGDTVHEFMFRRVSDVDWCLEIQKKYQRLIQDVKKVRIVGVSQTEKSLRKLITDRIPKKFKQAPKRINWYFTRLQTEKGCESYFSDDCQPENYWASTSPKH